ncbi:hypothetical protein AC578_9034 [Pseudocercospora eumusae]|uniref:Uncharacterized protein n=1 Tax=Pseudocercospora eumusae TaxID=321146 RepID=A0A139H8H5_9PEZI|nr:hypothetical protein AC578_9034 [Pseudocercospora eumusae]
MSHMIPTMKLVRLSGQLAPTSKLLAFPRSIQGVVLCVSITSELVLDIAAVASVRPDTDQAYFLLTLTRASEVVLSLSQLNTRCFCGLEGRYVFHLEGTYEILLKITAFCSPRRTRNAKEETSLRGEKLEEDSASEAVNMTSDPALVTWNAVCGVGLRVFNKDGQMEQDSLLALMMSLPTMVGRKLMGHGNE